MSKNHEFKEYIQHLICKLVYTCAGNIIIKPFKIFLNEGIGPMRIL